MKWIKVRANILDNQNIAELSDRQWREMVEAQLRDSRNWHCDPKPERRAWNSVRKTMTEKVLARDPHMCANCGSINELEIDHIIPLARGGTNDLDNLRILCKKCNQQKWAK